MPDEIDLLQMFRSDTPGPGEAAWEKARAAVTAVAEPVVVGMRDIRADRARRRSL